jgi:hypothetical protein
VRFEATFEYGLALRHDGAQFLLLGKAEQKFMTQCGLGMFWISDLWVLGFDGHPLASNVKRRSSSVFQISSLFSWEVWKYVSTYLGTRTKIGMAFASSP